MANVWMCGRPAQSKLSAELRRNGCSRTVSLTAMFSMNVAVTSCGPAVTGTRTRMRSSDGVAGVGRLVEHRRQVLVAADRYVVHLSPVDRDLELARILKPANDVQVSAIELVRNSYSASSGNVWRTRKPPTVPSGRPSMCWFCDRSCGTR